MSDEDRRLRGAKAVMWVHGRIVAAVPEGLGKWPGHVPIVEREDAAFVEALQKWMDSGAPLDLKAAMDTADALVDAWKRAGEAWAAA